MPSGDSAHIVRALPPTRNVTHRMLPESRQDRLSTTRATAASRRKHKPLYILVMDVPKLLDDLQSEDWELAARAAERLRDAPGRAVTLALAEALDAHNTAITDAATESLILRDEPATADLMWTALTTLNDDVTDQMWDVLTWRLPEHPVSKELDRRYRSQS